MNTTTFFCFPSWYLYWDTSNIQKLIKHVITKYNRNEYQFMIAQDNYSPLIVQLHCPGVRGSAVGSPGVNSVCDRSDSRGSEPSDMFGVLDGLGGWPDWTGFAVGYPAVGLKVFQGA